MSFYTVLTLIYYQPYYSFIHRIRFCGFTWQDYISKWSKWNITVSYRLACRSG